MVSGFNSRIWRMPEPVTLPIKANKSGATIGTRAIAHMVVMSWLTVQGSGLLGPMAGCFEHRALAYTVVCFALVH